MNKEEYLVKLGEHVSKLRKEAGLSQSELAMKCDKDRQNLNRLEKGRMNPTAFFLKELANALNVPAKDLLDF